MVEIKRGDQDVTDLDQLTLDVRRDCDLDLPDELDIADNTLVVFAGDNGPEEVLLWRGTPGYWEGCFRRAAGIHPATTRPLKQPPASQRCRTWPRWTQNI
jgi:arylsulfatase A-like enzyme